MRKHTISNNTKDIVDKRKKEKEIVSLMINMYCSGHKHTKDKLCTDCQGLLDYSNKRVDLCPFMETKTFCQNCQVHCYNEDMRGKIREVMRYSGPRMILYHPVLAIRHAVESYKEKKRRKKEE